MIIAEKNMIKANVILPGECGECEKFAASELLKYLGKVVDAEPVSRKDADIDIIIGSPMRNEYAKRVISESEFEKLVPGTEGFIIKSSGNLLLIAGSDDSHQRGTLYGVYEFLERYLGCSLCAYGNHNVQMGEFVPESDKIEIGEIEYVSPESDIKYRCAIVQYGHWVGNPNHALNDGFLSYLAKNRYNRILTWAGIYEWYKENGVLEETRKRGIDFTVGHHEFSNLFMPPEGNSFFKEKYYETHPEYYKLTEDGTRYKLTDGNYDAQLVFCMRNEECIEELANNIIKWTKVNPDADIISLWPSDGNAPQCVCEKCSKYSKSDNYTYFVNHVSEKVAEKNSKIKLDRIVYGDLIECGKEDINPSVVIDEAVWHESGLRKVGNPNANGYADSTYENILMQYKEKGALVVYYDYLMGVYGGRQKYMPAADEIQSICKRMKKKGVWGLGTQMDVFNHWNNSFNFYTYGRTAYNTELTMQDNIDRFTRIFGKGAEYIRKIITECERVVDGQVTIMEAQKYLIDNVDKEKIYDWYEQALESEKTPLFRNNIRMMRMVFRYSDLEVNSPVAKETPHYISGACDDEGELWYMSKNFNSYLCGNEGYGIALPVLETPKEFIPNKWYLFD